MMTAKKRIVINAKRNVKAAAGKVKNAQRKLSYAELQAQNAELQEQNAELQEQNAELRGEGTERKAQSSVRKAQSSVRKVRSIESQVQSIESKIEQKLAELHALNSELDSALDSAHDAAFDSAHDAAFDSAHDAAFDSAHDAAFDSAHDAKTRANPNKSPFSPFSPFSALSARLRAKAAPRANLPAPVLGDVVANGPHSITIHWGSVANASAYIVSVADNSTFDEANLFSAGPAATSWTVNGLLADTTYYVRVRANGSGEYGNSAYSASKSIATTGVGGGGDGGGNGNGGGDGGGGGGNGGGSGETDVLVDDLEQWLDDLQTLNQHFFTLLPHSNGEVLSSTARRRLLGSGVRRYGYIDKVSDTAEEYPQFWPAFVTDGTPGMEQLKEWVREIEVLRNLRIAFRLGTRIVEDMLLTRGDEAFRLANIYYRTVRDAARSNIAGAAEVWQMLQQFWKRRRRMTDEPTEKEIMRDAKGLMRGTKDGDITLANESDRIVRGKKAMIDNTFPAKQRASMKVMEEEEEEEMWE